MKILLLALRSLLRFRLYTLINILGLALSLACVIVICRYVNQEVMANHFVKDLKQVYLITRDKSSDKIATISGYTGPDEIADPLKDPAVEESTTLYNLEKKPVFYKDKKYMAFTMAVDSCFLDMMTYPVLKTSTHRLLHEPNEAVITEQYAHKLFGQEEPLGKTITSPSGKMVTITGVLKEMEYQTSFQFDLLISSSLENRWDKMPINIVRLHPHTDVKSLNLRFNKYADISYSNIGIRYQFSPLEKFYFDKTVHNFYTNIQQGNFFYVIILSAVTLCLFAIGLFNFINIYTVQIQKRGREFGMKKVFGANGWQMATQLYLENFFMVCIALFVASILLELTSGLFYSYLNMSPVPNTTFTSLLVLGILFLLPAVTSVYPFVRYNFSSPITSLRSVSRGGHSATSRSLLIGVQYTITFILVILSSFFIRQLNFMLNADLGYEAQHVLKSQLMDEAYGFNTDRNERIKRGALIEQRLAASPLFPVYAFSDNTPTQQTANEFSARISGQAYKTVSIMETSADYFKLFDIKLKEGRLWNDSIDTFYDPQFIINETAWKLFGFTDLSSAKLQPQQRLVFSEGMDPDYIPEYKIIGVVKDFITGHLSKATEPLLFYYYKNDPRSTLMAQVVPGKEQECITFLKTLKEEVDGGEFSYTFISDEVRAIYQKDQQITTICSFFACIAILISSLGLFSLSLFDVQQRYREIAIRKVNGATTSVIMKMLLRKYYKLLTIAFCISVPIAWLALLRYLEGFAHKAPISWWLFVIALLITGGISLATLIWQIQKAARTNPADAIKSE